MHPVERIIVPLILCCVLVGSETGQNPQAKHPKRQIRTAAGNARGQKPRIAQPKQQNQLPIVKPQTLTREKYDPAKNETTIDVPSMLVSGEQLDGLRMFVSFSYPGRTMQTPPDMITLILASTSAFSKYSDDDQRNLTAWADGESLDFGRMQLFYSYRGLGYVTEGMKVSVPARTFAQIANAQQVKMKLGPAGFRLRDSQLIALRDLGRRTDSNRK